MYDYTSNNWSHWNSNEKLKEKFGSFTRKTFDRFATKDIYIWNITHNTESTTVWMLKPERWGSPLVQEKYQEKKSACNKRHPCRIAAAAVVVVVVVVVVISSEWNVMWKDYFDLHVNFYNVPVTTNREHNQDGIVSVATKSEALPIQLNFLAYYTVTLQSLTSFVKQLMRERTLEYSTTVYFFLSYFFKTLFNVLFPSVPRRVTSSLKDFRKNIDCVIFLRVQLVLFSLFSFVW